VEYFAEEQQEFVSGLHVDRRAEIDRNGDDHQFGVFLEHDH
jgi:hypothetical protein